MFWRVMLSLAFCRLHFYLTLLNAFKDAFKEPVAVAFVIPRPALYTLIYPRKFVLRLLVYEHRKLHTHIMTILAAVKKANSTWGST